MSGCPANIRADARTGARLPAPALGVRGRHLPYEARNGRARRRGSGAGSREGAVAKRSDRARVPAGQPAEAAPDEDAVPGPTGAVLRDANHAHLRACGQLSLIHISEPTRLGMISYAV